MKILRSVSTALAVLLFAVAIVVWIVYVPERPRAIYQSIPAEADLVSVHLNLADRISGLMENKIFSRVMAATGMQPEQMESILNDESARLWLEQIASERVAFAHIPEQGFAGGSAWCMAAWVGNESLRLRWSIHLSASKESRIGSIMGTHIWRFELPDLADGQRLFCAVEEGVLLAAISTTPETIQRMILTYQGRNPSLDDDLGELLTTSAVDLAQYPDQFWSRVGQFGIPVLHVRFREISQLRLRGVIGRGLPLVDLNAVSGGLEAPPQVEWRQPIMQALLSAKTARSLAVDFADSPVGMVAIPLAGQVQAGPLFAGLFGDENQGRLKGFRIPGLLLAMPISDTESALRVMLARLDRLNAAYSLGIIYSRRSLADAAIYHIVGTRDNFYGDLPVSEQLAFMLRNDFLLLASHPAMLERMATDRFSDNEFSVWGGIRGDSESDYLWIDLDRSAKALRLALAVYSLKLIDEDPRRARVIRQRIDLARDWVDACVPYREALIWRNPSADEAALFFDMGLE